MKSNLDFLVLYAEITMAFVAFSTIVATLRQEIGESLTQLQSLLFHFFVEVGFLHLTIAIVPIALFTILTGELQIWRLSTYTILISTGFYLPFYISRRIKTEEQIPWLSRLVMVGYGISIIAMIATATELFWLPSLATTTYFLVWGLISNIAMFVYFLRTFVELDHTDPHL
jgi:hypothetical protein